MQCLGCKRRFKSQRGLILHLSQKPLCQSAMGMTVPPIHPPIQTWDLEPPPAKIHPNKKRPPPPLLQRGLVLPPSSKAKTTSKTAGSTTIPTRFLPDLSKKPGRSMDSHVLHSMFSAMLMDKSLEYNRILTTSHHPSTTTQPCTGDNPMVVSFDANTDYDEPVP